MIYSTILFGLNAYGLAAQEDGPKPGDVDLEVQVEKKLQPGTLDEPLPTTLLVTVSNKSGQPVEGVVKALLPAGPKWIPFTLPAAGQKKERITLVMPEGPPEAVRIPFTVESVGVLLLTMNVALTKAMGWEVIGPFEGNTQTALERAYPPEETIDGEAAYPGKSGRSVGWQALDPSVVNASGYYDLNLALGYQENATAYALTSVVAPEATKAILRLGSDDGIKVWLNGELIHTHAIHRGSAPGQDQLPVDLVRGRNEFLLKVCNDDGGWGFHFDLCNQKGEPLPGIETEVCVVRKYLRDPQLRVGEVTRRSAVLEWRTDEPVSSKITLVEADQDRRLVFDPTSKDEMNRPLPGAQPRLFSEILPCTDHTFTLEGLNPGARYLAWAAPGVGAEFTPKAAFYTEPPEGMTQYLVLKLAAVIFTATTPPADQEREGAKRPCAPAEVARVKREMDQAVLFYWINSGMRLFLDVEYFRCDRFYPGTHDYYGVGYGGEDERAYEEVLRTAGRSQEEFDGRLFISMEKRWDEGSATWIYPASGGGTIGPEARPGYGKSAWKGGSNNAWLFCHEFQHQLDALYAHSLGPEHLFCHFQPWDDTAHRHGEHWDGIAWILLEWAGYVNRAHQGRPYLEPSLGFRYFINRWGRVVWSRDMDRDGIPDEDPRVPLDEQRFNSDPTKRDTDGDGLSDMMEVLSSHGVEYGLNEIWAGPPSRHRADPRNPDTDGDGLTDGADPYPLYAIAPEITKSGSEEIHLPFRDEAWSGDFYLGWDDGHLYLRLTAEACPREIKILLDLDDDGWFMGGDNYDLRVRKGDQYVARFHNCNVPGKWPFFEDDRLEIGRDLFFESAHHEGQYRLRIGIARAPQNGLALETGEPIGVLLAVMPENGAGRPGQVGALTLFEPHTFFTFTLNE
jgi:hypothetical protein